MSVELALAGAVFDMLRAAPQVMSHLGDPARVYDQPPTDVLFPYVTLGAIQTEPHDVAGVSGWEHALTLHVWSRYGGRTEMMEIISALRAALHQARPTLSEFRIVLLVVAFTDIFRAADGATTHGVMRIRAITESMNEE